MPLPSVRLLSGPRQCGGSCARPAVGLGGSLGANDLKAAVHIGQGGGGGIGDGRHISDADIMASMSNDFIHDAFEGSGTAYHGPAGRVPAVDGTKSIGLFGVKSTRKPARQGACSFRQNIYAKDPVAAHGQTNPAVGSQAHQNGRRIGGKRGKGTDRCACGSVLTQGRDDRDRLRHMAHSLNKQAAVNHDFSSLGHKYSLAQTYRLWGRIQWRDRAFLWSSDGRPSRGVDLAMFDSVCIGLVQLL